MLVFLEEKKTTRCLHHRQLVPFHNEGDGEFFALFFFLFVSSQRVGCGLVSLKIVIGFFFVFFLFLAGEEEG